MGKPDLAPAAWVRRLVTLCDRAPATPIEVVKKILEEDFGQSFYTLFEKFDEIPLGSASIAQVPIFMTLVLLIPFIFCSMRLKSEYSFSKESSVSKFRRCRYHNHFDHFTVTDK